MKPFRLDRRHLKRLPDRDSNVLDVPDAVLAFIFRLLLRWKPLWVDRNRIVKASAFQVGVDMGSSLLLLGRSVVKIGGRVHSLFDT